MVWSSKVGKLRERAKHVRVPGNREYNPGWHTALDLLEPLFADMRVEVMHWIQTDPDLDAIRDHPHFKAILEGAQARLAPLRDHLFDAGLGTVSEIFDAAPPHTPRGTPSLPCAPRRSAHPSGCRVRTARRSRCWVGR